MINISDQLNAATEQGILGAASQIKDEAMNKNQSTINSEVQTSLAQKLGPEDYQTLYDLASAGLVL